MRSAVAVCACVVVAAFGTGCGAGAGVEVSAQRSVGAAAVAPAETSAQCAVPHAPAAIELEEGLRAAERGEVEDARRLLARACDNGNPCACTAIGASFVDPPDGARDAPRAAQLLERGCAGGDVRGCYALGSAIFRFLPERVEHARDLFEDACADGVPEACLASGRFRMTGVDGDRSASDALGFYDRACRAGVEDACVLLAEAYAAGAGTRRDPGQAAELLTRACDGAGIARACTRWADLLEPEDPQRDALLRRGCDGGDPVACDALAPEPHLRGDEEALRALAARQPAPHPVENGIVELETIIGGGVDLAGLGLRPACVGFVDAEPDAVLRVPEGATALRLAVRAPADAVLALRDPAGRWTCADDGVAGDYDPVVELGEPMQGDHLVWVGTRDREASLPARLVVSAVAPVAGITEASYDDLPVPTPEEVTMPDLRLRHYQLDVTAMPGLTGRVRIDGREVWSFENRGGHATLDEVQCALTPGTHTIDVELVRRGRDARLVGRAGSLIAVELRGALRRSQLDDDASRIHRLEWSPDEPGRRQLVVHVERRQGGDRSTCP